MWERNISLSGRTLAFESQLKKSREPTFRVAGCFCHLDRVVTVPLDWSAALRSLSATYDRPMSVPL
jgi:hypothetical protein